MANSPENFPIYIEEDSQTYERLKERANRGEHGFQKLLSRVQKMDWLELNSIEMIYKMSIEGNCGSIQNSYALELFVDIEGLSLNQIKYDYFHDRRLIRKDYEFAKDIIKMYISFKL